MAFNCNKGQHLIQVTRQDLVDGMAQKMKEWTGLPQGTISGYTSGLIGLILITGGNGTMKYVTSYHLSDNVVDTRDVTIKTCVALTFARILYFNAWDCFVSLSFHILRLKVRRIEKDSICRKKQLTQRGVSGAPSVEAL